LENSNLVMLCIRSAATLLGAVALPWCAASGQAPPLVDHHQHISSPANSEASGATPGSRLPSSAQALVAFLDSAGIRRGVVLSVAYQWGGYSRTTENEYEKVKAENDWTARQVALYPDRLVAFCGVNPLRAYALEEVARCASDPRLRTGLELQFGRERRALSSLTTADAGSRRRGALDGLARAAAR
jgi:predicted TIM-barrel fold metal-dependent hydrolase